jgi:hypothetical protein
MARQRAMPRGGMHAERFGCAFDLDISNEVAKQDRARRTPLRDEISLSISLIGPRFR